jgi:hypothetical protein
MKISGRLALRPRHSRIVCFALASSLLVIFLGRSALSPGLTPAGGEAHPKPELVNASGMSGLAPRSNSEESFRKTVVRL